MFPKTVEGASFGSIATMPAGSEYRFRGASVPWQSVAKLVEEKMLAMRPIGTTILVLGLALPAIQFGPFGDLLDDHVIFAVRVTL